jgi:hypothetical protein
LDGKDRQRESVTDSAVSILFPKKKLNLKFNENLTKISARKTLVYVDKPRDIPHLKNAIETELRAIPRRMCEQVLTNFSQRLNECVKNQGRHLNDVIFHV